VLVCSMIAMSADDGHFHFSLGGREVCPTSLFIQTENVSSNRRSLDHFRSPFLLASLLPLHSACPSWSVPPYLAREREDKMRPLILRAY